MFRRMQSIIAGGLVCVAGAASAQVPSAPFVPPEAELRTYTWEQAFPVTPPFLEWRQIGSVDPAAGVGGGRAWLHGNSLSWRAPAMLVADMLLYGDPTASEPASYVRVRTTILCDSKFSLMFDAVASVIIDPEGRIMPASEVREAPGVVYPKLNSVFEQLCTDPAFREPFMAAR